MTQPYLPDPSPGTGASYVEGTDFAREVVGTGQSRVSMVLFFTLQEATDYLASIKDLVGQPDGLEGDWRLTIIYLGGTYKRGTVDIFGHKVYSDSEPVAEDWQQGGRYYTGKLQSYETAPVFEYAVALEEPIAIES